MKKPILFVLSGLAGACYGQAQESARVLSSHPVIVQVAVPRTVCSPQPVAVAPPTTGAGSIIGAVAGGILGSTIGGGMGQAAAVALGAAGGALVGNHVEAGTQGHGTHMAQHCRTETAYENRTVGYDVSYEWGGRSHTVRMPYDPGPTVALQMAPVGAGFGAAAPDANAVGTVPGAGVPILRSYHSAGHGPAGSADGPHYPIAGGPTPYPGPMYAAPMYPAPVAYPAPIYYAAPVLPAYAVRPYYPPVGISLNFGYARGFHHRHGGHRHGGHRGWR